jgi:PhnB protein
MQINPYLSFAGRCREAFAFYAEVLGGHADLVDHDAVPDGEADPSWGDMVLHAQLTTPDGQVLMGADMPPEAGGGAAQGFCVSIGVDTVEEADRVFGALAEGGSVQMPLGETFFSKRFGMCTDRFGIPWMVNAVEPMG